MTEATLPLIRVKDVPALGLQGIIYIMLVYVVYVMCGKYAPG